VTDNHPLDILQSMTYLVLDASLVDFLGFGAYDAEFTPFLHSALEAHILSTFTDLPIDYHSLLPFILLDDQLFIA
jgi:hypothetical protein